MAGRLFDVSSRVAIRLAAVRVLHLVMRRGESRGGYLNPVLLWSVGERLFAALYGMMCSIVLYLCKTCVVGSCARPVWSVVV